MPKKRVNPKSASSHLEVRPIGARALKSAIDTLRPHLAEAHVLDLFAGQGRFGIAASEEKITSVTFVEKSPARAHLLSTYLKSPRFPKTVEAHVVIQEVLSFLEQCEQHFDVVFADPPFPLWNEHFEKMLFQSVFQVLKPGAIFLVKHPSRMVACSGVGLFNLVKTSEFGESRLLYFSYETN